MTIAVELSKILCGQFQSPQHVGLVQLPGCLLVRGQRSGFGNQRFGAEGLELYRIGAGLFCRVDEGMGLMQVSVMIDPRFSDDEARMSDADGPLLNV